MSPERFCDWLQGFVELSDTDTISDKQWLIIKDHLKLVFDKRTPDRLELTQQDIQRDLLGHQKLIDALRPKPIYSDIWKLGDPAPTITC